MADEENSGAAKAAVSHVIGMIPKDIREMIGMYYGIFLFMAAPIVIGLCLYSLYQFAHSMAKDDSQCWQLTVAKDVLYKINSCTGVVEKVEGMASEAGAK